MNKRYTGFEFFSKMCAKKDEILQHIPNAKFLNGYNEKDKHYFEVEE